MLVILALSSMFPTVECITTALIDQFSETLRPFKFWVTLVTCCVLFLVGCIMCTQGGMYVLNVLDKYAVGWALVIIGFFEVIVFAWRYGAGRILNDIEMMIGFRPSFLWRYAWLVVCPILLLFNLVFGWIDYSPLEYNGVLYPGWSNAVGWILTCASFLPIPIYGIVYLIQMRKKKNFFKKSIWNQFLELSAPAPSWAHPRLSQRQLSTISDKPDDLEVDADSVFEGFIVSTDKV